MGSEPGKFDLKTDGKKLAIGFGLAMAGAALTWIASTLIPALEQEGNATNNAILLFIAGLLATLVNAGRKWITDTRPKACIAFILVLLMAGVTCAEPILVKTSTGRHYLLTEDAAGGLVMTEIKTVVSTTPGDNPVDPVDPTPVDGFAAEVRDEISKTGDPETSLMFSGIYSLIADEIEAGNIEGKQGGRFAKIATDRLFRQQRNSENFDREKWDTYRAWQLDQLAIKEQNGELQTDAQWIQVNRQISAGAKAYADGSALRDRLDMAKIFAFLRELIEWIKIFKELLDPLTKAAPLLPQWIQAVA